MFSTDWDLATLHQKADAIITEIVHCGKAETYCFPSLLSPLPISPNCFSKPQMMIIASGYPERAGVWSYTLLEEAKQNPEILSQTSVASYFEQFDSSRTSLVFLNPQAESMNTKAEEAIPIYLKQLHAIYQHVLSLQTSPRIVLYGFSLGGEVILRFLQENQNYALQTSKLVLVDPSPPSIGRRKLKPHLLSLVDDSWFYGLAHEDGSYGEFAEFAKMRLKIKPQLFHAEKHGEMPHMILLDLFDKLEKL